MTIEPEPVVPEEYAGPDDPTLEGPHLVLDEQGNRRWAWWVPSPGTSYQGSFVLPYNLGRPHEIKWIGPAVTPDGEPL